MEPFFPRARQTGLSVQSIQDEVLVYDETNHQAHVLNRTTALVWKHCDGKTTVPALADRLTDELAAPVSQAVVWHALRQLDQVDLLTERVALPAPFQGFKRRDFIKAGAVGAAIAVPVIISLTAPTPAHAASGCIAGDC